MLNLNETLFNDFDPDCELFIDGQELKVQGPASPEDNGILNLLTQAINDEWQTITLYNNLITTLQQYNKEDMINVINDILVEENKHVGQLQELLKTVAPNTCNISAGEREAQGQLSEDLNEVVYSNKDHSRIFYQKEMADAFCKDLEAEGDGCEVELSSSRDSTNQKIYIVSWNDCKQLQEADTLHPKFKQDIKNRYKSFSSEEDRRKEKRAEIDDMFTDVDTKPEERERIYKLLNAEKRDFDKSLGNNRGNLEAKNFPFYVTYYSEYPIYEPAEGGYYYPGRNPVWSKGFETKDEAISYMNDYVRNDDDSDWKKSGNDSYSTYSKYIGDSEQIKVETNKEYLSDEAHQVPYQ